LNVVTALDIGVADRATCHRPMPLVVDDNSRGKNAFVYGARFPDEADPLELGLRNKSDNLAHVFRSKSYVGIISSLDDDHTSISRWGICRGAISPPAVTNQ
jgi:hypothetical protein